MFQKRKYIQTLWLIFCLSQAPCVGAQDFFEPDDLMSQAINVNINVGYLDRNIAPGTDDDWFSFLGFPGNPKYSIDLKNNGSGDLVMELFSPHELDNPIESVIIFGVENGGRRIIEFDCNERGRYFVRIRLCDHRECTVATNTPYSFQIEINTAPQDIKFYGYVIDKKSDSQVKGAEVVADNLKSCTTPFQPTGELGYYNLWVPPAGETGVTEIVTTASGYMMHRRRYTNLQPSSSHGENRYLLPVDLSLAVGILKTMAGGPSPENLDLSNDIDGDGRIGAAEAIFALQTLAGLR